MGSIIVEHFLMAVAVTWNSKGYFSKSIDQKMTTSKSFDQKLSTEAKSFDTADEESASHSTDDLIVKRQVNVTYLLLYLF